MTDTLATVIYTAQTHTTGGRDGRGHLPASLVLDHRRTGDGMQYQC